MEAKGAITILESQEIFKIFRFKLNGRSLRACMTPFLTEFFPNTDRKSFERSMRNYFRKVKGKHMQWELKSTVAKEFFSAYYTCSVSEINYKNISKYNDGSLNSCIFHEITSTYSSSDDIDTENAILTIDTNVNHYTSNFQDTTNDDIWMLNF